MPSPPEPSNSLGPQPCSSLFDSRGAQQHIKPPPSTPLATPEDQSTSAAGGQHLLNIEHEPPPTSNKQENRMTSQGSIPILVFARHWSQWRREELLHVLDHHSIDYSPQATQTELLVILYNRSLGNHKPASHPRTYGQLIITANKYFRVQLLIYRQSLSDGSRRPLHWANALLDSGANENLIAMDLVQSFDPDHIGPSRMIFGMDGQRVTTYGIYSVSIEATDCNEQTRHKAHCFVAVDRKDLFGIDMVLGNPWYSREKIRIEHLYRWCFPN